MVTAPECRGCTRQLQLQLQQQWRRQAAGDGGGGANARKVLWKGQRRHWRHAIAATAAPPQVVESRGREQSPRLQAAPTKGAHRCNPPSGREHVKRLQRRYGFYGFGWASSGDLISAAFHLIAVL